MEKLETYHSAPTTQKPLYISAFPGALRKDLEIIKAVGEWDSVQQLIIAVMEDYRRATLPQILNKIQNGSNQENHREPRTGGDERRTQDYASARNEEEQSTTEEASREEEREAGGWIGLTSPTDFAEKLEALKNPSLEGVTLRKEAMQEEEVQS
jgi:hypothetical protein